MPSPRELPGSLYSLVAVGPSPAVRGGARIMPRGRGEVTVLRWAGWPQELDASGWLASSGTASRSRGTLKRRVICTGMGSDLPLAGAEAGCRDRSRLFLWVGRKMVGGGYQHSGRGEVTQGTLIPAKPWGVGLVL